MIIHMFSIFTNSNIYRWCFSVRIFVIYSKEYSNN